MDWKVIANGPWIWIAGGVTAVIGLYQAWFFLGKARTFMHAHGFTPVETRHMIRGASITAIGPVVANIFVMIALAVAISPGLAFQREAVGVGSVFTELAQVSNAAIGAGEEFGTANFSMVGFAAAVLIMNIAGWGWSVEGIFTRYLGRAREKITGGDPKLLAVIAACGMIAVFTYYSVTNAVKGNGFTVAVIVAVVSSMLLFKASDWLRKPGLKEWALGIAMFIGMLAGKIVAG
jgi:hypothetical protein